MTARTYGGGELELFARAHNWKAYLREEIRPFLRGDVLEVGAGIGATTRALADAAARTWLCLEPDPELAEQLGASVRGAPTPPALRVLTGSVADLPRDPAFDAALYIDVLEHIEADAAELASVAARLRGGGHLVVLSPAHQFLMSDFDRAIGHHRRYDATSLAAIAPAGLSLARMRYLDCVGILASLSSPLLLRESYPTERQIGFWDRRMVPLSRRLDRWLAYRVGKSILAVWRKE